MKKPVCMFCGAPATLPQPCLTEEQAVIIRAAHWAGFANSYTRSIEILKGGGQQTFDF